MVRAGTVFNTLNLSVPDAETLAAAIEAARANAPTMAQDPAPMPDFKSAKKEPSRADLILGFLMLGAIGVGIVLYNLPEPAGRGAVLDRSEGLPVASAEPKSSPLSLPRAAPAAPMTGPAASPPSASERDAATQAAAVEVLCVVIQQMAVDLAEARNRGVPEFVAHRELLNRTPDAEARELVTAIVKMVYANTHLSPQSLGVLAHRACLKSWGAKR